MPPPEDRLAHSQLIIWLECYRPLHSYDTDRSVLLYHRRRGSQTGAFLRSLSSPVSLRRPTNAEKRLAPAWGTAARNASARLRHIWGVTNSVPPQMGFRGELRSPREEAAKRRARGPGPFVCTASADGWTAETVARSAAARQVSESDQLSRAAWSGPTPAHIGSWPCPAATDGASVFAWRCWHGPWKTNRWATGLPWLERTLFAIPPRGWRLMNHRQGQVLSIIALPAVAVYTELTCRLRLDSGGEHA